TDFIVRLLDILPDGTQYNLTEGILRARFRGSIWGEPKRLEPGKPYEFTITLQPTSNFFRKGHRIAVQITSSSFPLWDPNPNTGHPQGRDAELRPAEQAIFLGGERASRIELFVLDR
ncbi:MAG TPA: CocE/NonD family hydrolase, partial [Gammaproteobacteria bacterium]|nr:CocE/NonD family hydrolase [Gammaproteobacteria bacterium]